MNNENSMIKINESLCTKCGTCLKVCPYDVLVQEDNEVPNPSGEKYCVSCGHCIAICPEGAVNHDNFLKDRINPINQSMLPEPDQVMNLLRSRRSIRAFQDKPVEKELMELIIEGANTGPSPHNAHRVEYVSVQDKITIDKLVGIIGEIYGKTLFLLKNPEALQKLPEPIQQRIKAAAPQQKSMERQLNRIKNRNDILQRGKPSLLVLHGPKKSQDPFEPKIDATIALQNASLVCSSLGLGSCELGYLEIIARGFPDIQNLLSISDDHCIYGILAIGHPKYIFKNWIKKSPAKITWK